MYQSSCWKLCIQGGCFFFLTCCMPCHLVCGQTPSVPVVPLLINRNCSWQKKKKASSSFFCTCSALCLGNETSSASNATPGAVCIPPTLFSTKLTAGDQYGSILSSASVSLRQLKFSSPEAAPQIDSLNLTWLDSTAAETHTANTVSTYTVSTVCSVMDYTCI